MKQAIISIFTLFLLFSGISASISLNRRQVPKKCVSGVHVIVARGSGEAPGEGITGVVAEMITSNVTNSDSIGLPYPATIEAYPESEETGTLHLTKYIQEYVHACPKARIALLGYSQGAQVVADTLCGTSEGGFTKTAPIPTSLGKHVVASIWFGDPSHVPGQPWNRGTSKRSGFFPRKNNRACDPYKNRILSYCDHRDYFCDSGNSFKVHDSYVQEYGKQAAKFVINKALA